MASPDLMLTLQEELGRGGMGVVFRAYHNALCRTVAVKFLIQPAGVEGRPDAARFKREMEVLISLEHPNIVRVLDAGIHKGRLYYAMELLEAQDLGRILDTAERLRWEEATRVIDQLLAALNYIHARNLVHRDVKPANVMIEWSGRVVLMDFGAVRKLDVISLAQGLRVVGTVNFVAPEILNGKQATASTDLWSLGVTAYRMLSGLMPFQGSAIGHILAAITGQEPARLADVVPDLPPELAPFIHRFLEKDPDRRWRSAAEARSALRALPCVRDRADIARTPVAAPSRPRSTAPERKTGPRTVMRPPRRGRWLWRIAAVALVLVGTWLAVRFFLIP